MRNSEIKYPNHCLAGQKLKKKILTKPPSLQDKATQRKSDLEDSLQAQQYFADANEAESWMREKEPIVGNTDYGKDEDSAEVCRNGRVLLVFNK